MPTLIAFKDGAEYDRVVGGKQPRDLLDWLEGLLRGETVIERLRALASEGGTDVEKRYELARALLSDGKLAEATSEFAWLWEHMNEFNPGMTGVRVSYMAGDIETLVAQDELARSRSRAIRDPTALRADLDAVHRIEERRSIDDHSSRRRVVPVYLPPKADRRCMWAELMRGRRRTAARDRDSSHSPACWSAQSPANRSLPANREKYREKYREKASRHSANRLAPRP